MENVWIIGGTSGIGEAIGSLLMSEATKTDAGLNLHVTDEHDVNVVNTATMSRFYRREGPFNHIVYSAGVNKLAWARDMKVIDMMMIMDINAVGFMRLISIVDQNNMGMDKPQSITAIVSDAATHPMRTSMAYCASKAALAMAVRCAARELAPKIRVNGVSPGVVAGTPMTNKTDLEIEAVRGWTGEMASKYELMNMPMHRRALPEEVAQVVRDVMYGPPYLTGSIIEVNGAR